MPSYEKNKSSGLWSCRFREKDENGVSHQKRLSGFSTKREAQFGYEDYLADAKIREEAKKAAQKIKDPEPDAISFFHKKTSKRIFLLRYRKQNTNKADSIFYRETNARYNS